MKKTVNSKRIRRIRSREYEIFQTEMLAPLGLMGIQARLASIVLILVSATLLGCAKQPTPDECKAAIVHMMEVQLDSPDFQKTREQAAGPGGQPLSAEQVQESAQWLKSQIPSLVTPEFVSQCVQRMKRGDIQCTMSATTTNELVEKCHWKVVAGPRGATLGF